MAQYQHLPIYKSTYELLQHITRVTKEFPRDYKHSLAAKLRDEAVDLVVFIYKANSVRADRGRHVGSILCDTPTPGANANTWPALSSNAAGASIQPAAA